MFALSREESDRGCLYANELAEATGMPFHTARRALGELRGAGFAAFSMTSEGGRIQHRWAFHWSARRAA
ncbi:hypothetical protein GCM10022254_50230 [Actinomadura meridiana]|uniref:Helix-turn-helix domain-containing protein n=1 Tax=Actinomadura meridiana TaxID=559626 RepID=A0ABP8CCM1_9ACTN